MKAILDESAIRIAYAAANDSEVRATLQYVRIGNRKIVASDGFMLASKEIETEPEDGEFMLIPAKAMLAAHKVLGGEKLIIESRDDEFATIENEHSSGIMISVQLLQAKYPAYEEIIKLAEKKRKAYVALDISKLVKAIKTASLSESTTIKIKVREPTDPIELIMDKTRVIIMPLYLAEE